MNFFFASPLLSDGLRRYNILHLHFYFSLLFFSFSFSSFFNWNRLQHQFTMPIALCLWCIHLKLLFIRLFIFFISLVGAAAVAAFCCFFFFFYILFLRNTIQQYIWLRNFENFFLHWILFSGKKFLDSTHIEHNKKNLLLINLKTKKLFRKFTILYEKICVFRKMNTQNIKISSIYGAHELCVFAPCARTQNGKWMKREFADHFAWKWWKKCKIE